MVHASTQLKFQSFESELTALFIEAELIRLHQPTYNSLLKDDKSPLYLVITVENYPKILTRRKQDLDHQSNKDLVFGPFSSATQLKEALKIIRPIFPWCNQAGDHSFAELKTQTACFYHQLDLCPGACCGKISPNNYQQNIDHLKLFFQGKSKQVIKLLQIDLDATVKQENFEKAAQLRDQIELLTQVTQTPLKLKPNLVLPNLTNHYREQGLIHLRKILSTYLHLPKTYPLDRIEAYDVSNTAGKQASVSMVTFDQGQPDKKNYRLFNIKTLETPNDYQMLKEAIDRRQNHPKWGRPDLMVIDGGKGQLRAALTVMRWQTPVVSLVKNPDRLIIPQQISRDKNLKLKINYQEIRLPASHPTLHLLAHLRDEAHRFSKKQHTGRRLKDMFK